MRSRSFRIERRGKKGQGKGQGPRIRKGHPFPPPFQQGDLDGLCGPYCLVNAVRYLRPPLPEAQALTLLRKILRHLERIQPLLNRFTAGTGFKALSEALLEVVCRHHMIHHSRPFRGQRGLTLERYLQALETFLDAERRIVLVRLAGVRDHWTLIRQLTAHSLLLYDSDHLQWLQRRHCALMSSGDTCRRHRLHAGQTYFLWVD